MGPEERGGAHVVSGLPEYLPAISTEIRGSEEFTPALYKHWAQCDEVNRHKFRYTIWLS